MINRKRKGKVGELEWVAYLKELGFKDVRRGVQYSGSADSPDVVGGILGVHCEVKRRERLNIQEAIAQAEEDVNNEKIPVYVAHRSNRKPWLITIRAIDLIEFAKAVLASLEVK